MSHLRFDEDMVTRMALQLSRREFFHHALPTSSLSRHEVVVELPGVYSTRKVQTLQLMMKFRSLEKGK